MSTDKMSVSLDPERGDAIRAAARQRGRGVSTWMAEVAAAKLRADSLSEFLDQYESEHGALSAAELATAAAHLAVPLPADVVEPSA